MKTISKDALRNMIRRKEGWKLVPDGVQDLLNDVVYNNWQTGHGATETRKPFL